MLAAHVDSGHRLRQGLSAMHASDQASELPHEAEAIFDANGFRMTDAVGQAKESTAMGRLRKAAVAMDRARGKMRNTDPQGQSNKRIAYRLGLSPSRVSALLRYAMRKLNVQTRVQLVLKMREFQTMD